MNIGIWGDSITHGESDSEVLGWVGRVRKSLLAGSWSAVYNRGICGDTTEDVLRRFSVEAEAIHPNVVVFAIGINDSKYPSDKYESLVVPEKYRANLRELVALAKRHTDQIYIVSATPVGDEWRVVQGSRFLNEVIVEYNELMAQVAAGTGVTFIDVFSVIDPSTDLADGLHPNAAGYEKMAEVIQKQIVF